MGNCGIFEVKRLAFLGKLIILLKLEHRATNQDRSVGGSRQWISEMCPCLSPSVSRIYVFRKQKPPIANWRKITGRELRIFDVLLRHHRFLTTWFFGKPSKYRDLYRRVRKFSDRIGRYQLGIRRRNRRNSRHKWKRVRIFSLEINDEILNWIKE